jgi:hypothetical protein
MIGETIMMGETTIMIGETIMMETITITIIMMETKLHRGKLKREEENIIKNDFKYNIFKIKMDRLNELFDNLYVKQTDRYVIKNKLLEIVQCYLQDIGMNFVVFNENSKSFIKKYGEEIIIQ